MTRIRLGPSGRCAKAGKSLSAVPVAAAADACRNRLRVVARLTCLVEHGSGPFAALTARKRPVVRGAKRLQGALEGGLGIVAVERAVVGLIRLSQRRLRTVGSGTSRTSGSGSGSGSSPSIRAVRT